MAKEKHTIKTEKDHVIITCITCGNQDEIITGIGPDIIRFQCDNVDGLESLLDIKLNENYKCSECGNITVLLPWAE